MRWLPIRRPVLGLSIGAETLGLVEVRRSWRATSLRQCRERTLPAGVLTLSASESNVADVSALAKEISALLDAHRAVTRPVPIALSLPDRCARVALMEFDTLPPKSSDVEALVRWRLQKELHVPVAETRLAYQVFPPAADGGPRRILAVSVREHVLGPYEQACEQAGCLPVRVGLTSLHCFDLCGPAMAAALTTTEECFYLYVGEGSFAFLALRAGGPVFLRSKPLRTGSRPEQAALASALTEELLATLHFYLEREPVSGPAPAARRLLFLVQAEGLAPTLPDALGVTVVPWGWRDLRIATRVALAPQFTGLPALAGVMDA